MKYGYARVSTEDQNPALQLAALKRAGCRKTFKDERTGATTKRPALLRCLKALQNGDTLIVWKLDRLARSLRDLVSMLDDFHQRGIHIFTALAEFEVRWREGLRPLPPPDYIQGWLKKWRARHFFNNQQESIM